VELEHLKIKTTLIDEMFASLMGEYVFLKYLTGTSKSLTGREMPRKKGLEEAEIQKMYTTTPEHLTDDELLLSTLCEEDLVRKQSGGWDNDHPKFRF
jgi:hypothetical protein